MRIGILGYGKMGKAVEQQARLREHEVMVLRSQEKSEPDIDCVIDFTHADIAPEMIKHFVDLHIPVVSGTTGWTEQLEEVEEYCRSKSGALCWSPNYSVGMHIMFQMNRQLAKIMAGQTDFRPAILERHHTEKKDKPSGTAIALAEQMIEFLDQYHTWDLHADAAGSIPIEAERAPDVKGIHRVTYTGPYESISLRHHALTRDGFAFGAVLAAEWLVRKVGCYRFEDVLHFPGQL